jgi:FkbM family methyltransferase
MEADLIYDFGMHDGRDTAFYLAKGFRVIAVEAMPDLCEQACERFADQIKTGALTIINRAVVDTPGPVTFYTNPQTVWGTAHRSWAHRNASLGSPSNGEITVDGALARDLFAEYGIPYYAKVDIEGSDRLCLEALLGFDDRPRYVSVESDKVSFRALEREFDLLERLGYSRFKVVPQHKVTDQRPPQPPAEGEWVQHTFQGGESGLFGQEAPGRWLSRHQAVALYRLIFARYLLVGDRIEGSAAFSAKVARRGLRKVIGAAGWYDTHAAR